MAFYQLNAELILQLRLGHQQSLPLKVHIVAVGTLHKTLNFVHHGIHARGCCAILGLALDSTHGFLQLALEVNVLRAVTGRIHVGHVGRNCLLAARRQLQIAFEH